MLNRREVLSGAAAAAALGRWSHARSGAPASGEFSKSQYQRAIVIDALGAVGDNDPAAADDAPLTARALEDARESGVTAVNFTINEPGNGPDKFKTAVTNIAGVEHEFTAHPEFLVKIQRAADIQAAKASKRIGIIYGCQDVTMLEGDIKKLATFADLGLRIVQPTYNRRNLMGDGCLEKADGGLSKMGYDLIAEINRLNLLLDLSHAGVRTITEGIAASKAPMAITHTGCRALVDLPRNTPDTELKALADRGGVVGIYFMPFLRASGQPHAEDLIRHIEHAVNVCGEEHVGLGTDGSISAVPLTDAYREWFRKSVEARQKAGISAPGESADVFTLVLEYNDPLRFMHLANDLARRGWPGSRIEKLLGANFSRLFADVWDAHRASAF
jgi:membrane dipeptidase